MIGELIQWCLGIFYLYYVVDLFIFGVYVGDFM